MGHADGIIPIKAHPERDVILIDGRVADCNRARANQRSRIVNDENHALTERSASAAGWKPARKFRSLAGGLIESDSAKSVLCAALNASRVPQAND